MASERSQQLSTPSVRSGGDLQPWVCRTVKGTFSILSQGSRQPCEVGSIIFSNLSVSKMRFWKESDLLKLFIRGVGVETALGQPIFHFYDQVLWDMF